MKEYIDRGALLKELERFPHLQMAGGIVRSMPKEDVAPVVRCKDCKHYRKKEDSLVYDEDTCDILYYCDGSHRTACEMDFCSYGERKMRGNEKSKM